ncbi:unnamed protein product [Phytomonas sp. Hart1]|nr:unnamed protein product [Phytomonas sp. Hart1]|eukprot:CCW69345.1 unnamed protein product [Phytomonas sp. isolate Hart1]
MSQDSHYQHRLWHLECPTLAIYHHKLELLLDFDLPSSFMLPPNCPLNDGLRPSYSVAAASIANGGGDLSLAWGRRGMFGCVGATPWRGEDSLANDWRELGIPFLSNE